MKMLHVLPVLMAMIAKIAVTEKHLREIDSQLPNQQKKAAKQVGVLN